MDKVRKEVSILKKLNNQLKTYCNVQERTAKLLNSPLKMLSEKVPDFNLKQNCTLFAISENYFVDFISKWQMKMSGVKVCQNNETIPH